MHSFFKRHPAWAIAVAGILSSLVISSQSAAQVVALPAFNADIKETSVSGLSSGGFMAVQFEVAYSSILKGAGVIAGGPYYCAQGNGNTAQTICSCTSITLPCRVAPGATDVPALIRVTDQNASAGTIDATSNLANHRIWMFSGTADTLVPQAVMNDLETYYRHYISNAASIRYEKTVAAQHAMPTDFFGHTCGTLLSPYINNCPFDAAGELLKWVYGSNLTARNTGALGGRFIEFDQKEFIDDHNPKLHGMADSGFVYVPATCAPGTSQPCKVHVVFHGCAQDPTHIQDTYVKDTGYNQWADTNNIIVLYPQTAPIFPLQNPLACWDFWNYDDPNYAKKSGRQMIAVKKMLDRITGSSAPSPTPSPSPTATCFTATNVDHVLAGRAHDTLFSAVANGSNQIMGLDNIFITTTLKQTGPNFYVISGCP
jgi:poly(3-hydroxybutyrate) depolymerase